MHRNVAIWSRLAVGACALALLGGVAVAQQKELCGRPRDSAGALLKRLKTEGLKSSNSKGYMNVEDKANGVMWTFTRTGHPAHPSVICREPVEDGGKLRIDMTVQCEASSDDACADLVQAFEAMNAKMIEDAKKRKGR